MSLGRAELVYDVAGGHDTDTQQGRALFWGAVAEHAPGCVVELRGLLSAWKTAERLTARLLRTESAAHEWAWMLSPNRKQAAYRHLRQRFIAWRGNWRLTPTRRRDAWIDRHAMYTLAAWDASPTLGHEPLLFMFTTAQLPSDGAMDAPFNCTQPAWRPDSETWDSFTARLDQRFALAKAEHKELVLRLFAAAGWVPATNKKGSTHFEWLARYQVAGQRSRQIADSAALQTDAVMKGIRSAAEIVGIDLRPSARGRPTGVSERRRRRRAG